MPTGTSRTRPRSAEPQCSPLYWLGTIAPGGSKTETGRRSRAERLPKRRRMHLPPQAQRRAPENWPTQPMVTTAMGRGDRPSPLEDLTAHFTTRRCLATVFRNLDSMANRIAARVGAEPIRVAGEI